MTAARTRASMMIVRFWRRRKASAPSLIAFEISCIAEVPVSRARTQRARSQATPRDPSEVARIRGRALADDINQSPIYLSGSHPLPWGEGRGRISNRVAHQCRDEILQGLQGKSGESPCPVTG